MFSANFSRLILEHLPVWAANEKTWFDRAAGDRRDQIIILGFGDLGQKLLRGLRRAGLEPLGIIDTGLSLRSPIVEGLPCVDQVEGAARWGDQAVFIVAVFNQSGERAFATIRSGLQAMGVKRVEYFMPLFWKFPEVFLPHYSIDLPSRMLPHAAEILQAFGLLHDDRSREDFAFFMESILSPEPAHTLLPTDPGQTYFPTEIIHLSGNEVFVDCGAYDGDTLVKFHQLTSGRFSAYFGVEPDQGNFQKLQECIHRLRQSSCGAMEAWPVALGRTERTAAFDSLGTISSAINQGGGSSIAVKQLGSILGDRIPTLVKMDIEGFELEALEGARSLLQSATPRLAICIYHVQEHPWCLPLYIHRLSSHYDLFIRRHCEHLDNMVAYAINRNHVMG